MKATYIIPAKPSNTGSIHDIADTIKRPIVFASGSRYAVVLSRHYGGKGYTTHSTQELTIKKSRSLKEFSHKIIDTDGNYYYIGGRNNDKLIRDV